VGYPISVNVRADIERYNMVNDSDLKLAAQRKEEYLRAQMGTIMDTVHGFNTKRSQAKDA
jgi:hypothetical protein